MSEKSEFTVNVKVNGLEDVERLAESIRDLLATGEKVGPVEPEGPRFSIGDVVHLVSGGPPLTVESVRPDGVACIVWFVDDIAHRAQFPADCLEY